MKVFLMYRDRDFELKKELPWNQEALFQDLELGTLLKTMAQDDEFLYQVSKEAVFTSLNDRESILYRQEILKDCMANPDVVRQLYTLSVQAQEAPKGHYWGTFVHFPNAILDSSVEVMSVLMDILKSIRAVGDTHSGAFVSGGFQRFWEMIREELSDDYFETVRQHLKDLKFNGGVLISAELTEGNKGTDYVLRKSAQTKQRWLERLFGTNAPAFSFYIADRDESGMRALSEIRDEGINLAANALSQSTEHVLSFFEMLRTELAFYIGCINLSEQLQHIGEPLAYPDPTDTGERYHCFQNLYDVCLALTKKESIIGNNLNCNDKSLILITGANQGGKSTFLRSIGLAQLMMQCGMFVPAESFQAGICTGLYTHYRREEDSTLESGKLDEELGRMSEIVDHLSPNALILFNESFAATNEREGSEIARQIVRALLERQMKLFFVTHLYEFAHDLFVHKTSQMIFLRAERQDDGQRTFQLAEGEPLKTSFGEDLYEKIFCESKQGG